MTYNEILKMLDGKMVLSVKNDINTIVFKQMCYHRNGYPASNVVKPLMDRWNCCLDAEDIEQSYKDRVVLTIVTLLHKAGLVDADLTKKAMQAIEHFKKDCVLGENFSRQGDKVKALLKSTPQPLTKKPGYKESITFYRAKDVVAIQLDGKYCAAYVLTDEHNEHPTITFYRAVFDHLPTLEEVQNVKIKKGFGSFMVAKMTYLPDYANQIRLIAANVELTPDGKPYKRKEHYSGVVTNMFELQGDMRRLFQYNEEGWK